MNQSKIKSLLSEHGCEYIGQAQGWYWFNELKTGSTLVIKITKFNEKRLRKTLKKHWEVWDDKANGTDGG